MIDTIGIINYGIAGNIHSVRKAIEKAGGKTVIINSPADFNLIDKLQTNLAFLFLLFSIFFNICNIAFLKLPFFFAHLAE